MKKVIAGILCVMTLTSVCALSADEAAPAPAPAAKSIAVVAVGPVDSALVDRVVAFAKENTALNIRVLPAVETSGETLDACAAEGAKGVGADDAALIVLASPSSDIKPHGSFLPEQHQAVVNVKSLVPAGEDAEVLGRRVEREVMQSIGLLMGVPVCPNPQCAMWQYTTDEELDAKGRNYCPPCAGAVQQAAAAKGVGIDMDNASIAP